MVDPKAVVRPGVLQEGAPIPVAPAEHSSAVAVVLIRLAVAVLEDEGSLRVIRSEWVDSHLTYEPFHNLAISIE